MFTGVQLFHQDKCDDATLFNAILNKRANIDSPFISDSARDLINQLLAKKPGNRFTNPEDIKKHPFFKNIDWSLFENRNIIPPFVPAPLNL
jgi:serine/threonine protein kinase